MSTYQQDLFTAQQERDKGIERAWKHARREWAELAEECAMFLADCAPADPERGLDAREFTTDDVWREINYRCETLRSIGRKAPTTHEPRALGAVMVRLAKEGKITKTGRYLESRRAEAHCNPKMVWRGVR